MGRTNLIRFNSRSDSQPLSSSASEPRSKLDSDGVECSLFAGELPLSLVFILKSIGSSCIGESALGGASGVADPCLSLPSGVGVR